VESIDDLIASGKVKLVEIREDTSGNKWRSVRFPSGSIITELVHNKVEEDHKKEVERKNSEIEAIVHQQKEKDRMVIESSKLSKDLKEVLIRRFRL